MLTFLPTSVVSLPSHKIGVGDFLFIRPILVKPPTLYSLSLENNFYLNKSLQKPHD